MDKGLIPRRYAKALMEVAAERNDDKTLYALMQSLVQAFANTKGLSQTLANPFVDKNDKIDLLTKAVYGQDATADSTYEDFLKLLAQNGRIDMAREIALAYVDLYRRKHSIYRVNIVSAAPLDTTEKERLQNVIQKHIGNGTFEFEYSVDPSLIGGFTVTVNSERLDASVAAQLKLLRLKLVK
ncbi:MAG: F0F1 ATP synthase subunit delta [Muribaculaceae bacterium]|nr:F0F1 ATP synthase subunit delta [Muribaculaceae bacterium]